jgi:Mrp family chromosome partitioning ATPase
MRRSRWVIVAGAVIGVVLGWVSAPGNAAPLTFKATNISIFEFGVGGVSQARAAVLATTGAVPRRVAGRLGIDVDLVQSHVQAEFRSTGSVLLITGRSADAAQAEALANGTAEELIVELGGPNSPLRLVERAVASPDEQSDVVGPRSRRSRALVLGAFGLFLGIASALTLDRLDHRIHSKSAVEEVLGVPVITEVPAIPRADLGRIVSHAGTSPFVEAYRALRTNADRFRQLNSADRTVIVVTSPVGGEGTTTTVAHLAVMLGEIGRSVVAISADLRHPRLHQYFDKAREPGLTDVLRGSPGTRCLADLNLATTIRGVQFVASGAPVHGAASLLDRFGEHLGEARSLADFVLIDAPPLLTTSDGPDLARHSDGVLLVVRSGWTSVRAAARSVELLERLDIPVLGAVLVGTVTRTRSAASPGRLRRAPSKPN